MPKIDLTQVQGKKTRHPDKEVVLDQVAVTKMERIAITVEAGYARKVKAAAKLRGCTIKQFVMAALDAQYPDL